MSGQASVTSEPHPQSGQHHRSSGNFSTEGLTGSKFKWSCPQGIVFNVKKDKSWASDPTIFSDVTNGTITNTYDARSLYIADPRHASENFTVKVEGID